MGIEFRASENIRENMTAYARFIARIDRILDSKLAKTNPLSKAWHHPAGPKTVFFWAPAWKWSLVIAGISDLARPAHKLSLNANISLVANGAVYTRWYYRRCPGLPTLAL